ncbi:DUF6879 family protein [Streptomyces sp. NBC_01477]|uniref:DUF6879 family protein n=1 Tax=Streptomyces sp. NBC_01477 TaxID=2976015 RepID=UPI002E3399BD|nr:DUF6879 family protein [Streptomyces sp. NBC_01477]
MPQFIDASAITEFFRDGFEHTAWRLEARRAYQVDYESARFQAYLRGEDPGTGGREAWLGTIRDRTATGARVERVRLYDEPPTDYQRFLLWGTVHTVAAGEDIRYLMRTQAESYGLPARDFWLFDSRVLGEFRYDGDRSLGMQLTEDPTTVVAACRIRDAAWHHAVPYGEFAARVASAV